MKSHGETPRYKIYKGKSFGQRAFVGSEKPHPWSLSLPSPNPRNPGDSASKLAHLSKVIPSWNISGYYLQWILLCLSTWSGGERDYFDDYFIENFYDGKCQIFKTRENPCTHATQGSTITKSRPVSFCFSPTHSHTPAGFLKTISKYIAICSKLFQHCLSKRQRFWDSRPRFRYHTKKIKTLAP